MQIEVQPGEGRRTPIGRKSDIAALCEGRLQFAGSGAYKEVFLSADGRFVYKRGDWATCYCYACRHEDVGQCLYEQEIIAEFVRLNELRAQGHTWAAPTSLYTVDGHVISCQPAYTVAYELDYCRPERLRLDHRARSIEWPLFHDNHSGNYGRTKAGHLRVFDGVV